MPWTIPDGILSKDTINVLSVKLVALKDVQPHLITIRNKICEVGCDTCTMTSIFDIICSAIYHYDHLNDATKEKLDDIMHRLYR